MTDLQILIFLIVALLAAVAYWAHIGKDKVPVWAGNLVIFTLYSSWCGYSITSEGTGGGGQAFAALMFWFLLLIVHILVALIVIAALRINKKTE
jgi:hypothetical protein